MDTFTLLLASLLLYTVVKLCYNMRYTYNYFTKYEARLKALKGKTGIKVRGPAGGTPHADDEPTLTARKEEDVRMLMSFVRESFAFMLGGKAALVQTAHPFVATGVTTHSYIKEGGTQKRFFRTFYYMFRLAFGDRSTRLGAASSVSRIHAKVKGTLNKPLPPHSLYQQGDTYTARDVYALRWVWMTLAETQLQAYQYVFGELPQDIRDRFVQAEHHNLSHFGVSPNLPDTPNTEEELLELLANGVYPDKDGKVLATPGGDAIEIQEFLWVPPHPAANFFLRWLHDDTACSLPGRMAEEYGMHVSPMMYFMFCFRMSLLRCIYRGLPPSVRYLTPYHYFNEREGDKAAVQPVSKGAAWLANFIITSALPMGKPEPPYAVTTLVCSVLQPVFSLIGLAVLYALAAVCMVVTDLPYLVPCAASLVAANIYNN